MALPTKTVSTIFSKKVRQKQKMPKLCSGLMVCHTGLP